MTNQGKLLTKLNPRYVMVLRAYLGWSIEAYVSKLTKYILSFYRNVSILCAKISSVYKPLTWLNFIIIKCFDTIIYMKTQWLQTNKMQHYCRKENAWEAERERERVALIKSLITWDWKDALEARLQKIELKMSADTTKY